MEAVAANKAKAKTGAFPNVLYSLYDCTGYPPRDNPQLEPQSTQSGNGHFLVCMRVKSAHAGLVGECTPTPFHYIYHQVQSCSVRSS